MRSPSQKPMKAREDIALGQLLSHYRNVLMNAVLCARDVCNSAGTRAGSTHVLYVLQPNEIMIYKADANMVTKEDDKFAEYQRVQ